MASRRQLCLSVDVIGEQGLPCTPIFFSFSRCLGVYMGAGLTKGGFHGLS